MHHFLSCSFLLFTCTTSKRNRITKNLGLADLVLQVAQYVTKRSFGSPPSLSAFSALDPSSQEHVSEIWLAHFNNFVLGSYSSNLSGRDFERDQAKPVSYLEVQTQSWSCTSSIRRGGRSHLQDCALLLPSSCRCSGLRART
jgi:hypothetical protein